MHNYYRKFNIALLTFIIMNSCKLPTIFIQTGIGTSDERTIYRQNCTCFMYIKKFTI